MRVALPRRPEGGVGEVSAIAAWYLSTAGVLERLRDDLHPYQRRLSFSILTLWSHAVPRSLGPDGPFVVTERDASDIIRLLEDGATMARLVRIFRTILPQGDANRDRDNDLAREMLEFCERTSDAVRAHLPQGTFTLERWVVDVFIVHCRNLLRVVLGDGLLARFQQDYDACMQDLSDQVLIAQKLPN